MNAKWLTRPELLLAAESGLLGLTGEPGRVPVWPAGELCRRLGAWTDLLPGTLQHLAPAAGRLPFPEGPAALRWLAGLDVAALRHGALLARRGPRDSGLRPDGPYPSTILPCADGYVQVQAGPADPALLAVLTGDDRLADPAVWAAPGAHADSIDEACRAWLAERTALEAATAAQELRQPWVPVKPADPPVVQAHRHPGGGPQRDSYGWSVAPLWQPADQRVALGPMTDVPWLGSLEAARVVELSVAVAGPMAGGLLAAAGAQVTRVVHPLLEAPGPYDGEKRLVRADLATEAGRAELEALLTSSDVLLTNLSPRTLRNLGLDGPALAKRERPPVLVTIAAFAPDEPWAAWAAFDAGIQAACGLAAATRYPGGAPLRVAGHPIDGATALWAFSAVLGALARQREAPHAQQVLTVVMERVGQVLMAGPALGVGAPPLWQGVLPCGGAERWLALVVGDRQQWDRLRQLAPALPAQPGASASEEVLAEWSRTWERDRLAHLLSTEGLDAAPVLMPGEW